MAKSVNLLTEALSLEQRLKAVCEEALTVMAHEDAKGIVEGIIKKSEEQILEIQKIIEQSKKCPAITK